jgi:hypothetical protein
MIVVLKKPISNTYSFESQKNSECIYEVIISRPLK